MIVLFGFVFFAVFAVVIIGMIAHFMAFGSIVWLVAKRVSDAAEEQRPKPCPYCGSMFPAGTTACGTCGAPRDAKQVPVGPPAENPVR